MWYAVLACLVSHVTKMTFGAIGKEALPHVIVGGNCNIQGFSEKGEEMFFTITGDNITSMALLDYNDVGFLNSVM